MIIAFQVVLLLTFIIFAIGAIAEDKTEKQAFLGLASIIVMAVLYKTFTL